MILKRCAANRIQIKKNYIVLARHLLIITSVSIASPLAVFRSYSYVFTLGKAKIRYEEICADLGNRANPITWTPKALQEPVSPLFLLHYKIFSLAI